MGRLRTETIKIDPALLHRTPASAELTPAILADYSARMRAQRRREDSMRSCEKVLRQFYDFLPESKTVTKDTLQRWREQLLAENYWHDEQWEDLSLQCPLCLCHPAV
ncbi:hypothetical protein JQM68_03950 [Oscillibacter valericigenes]|uniref:hypothetical protein n=1 Tax=Oscillibacter valericigenes TaxID=351091 RepID=UPI001F473CAC|nr:hypothetical protein [Oscillibacter valericigenes]MCF2616347.1 hypothetical protein [Oscillibacter valericigenes]